MALNNSRGVSMRTFAEKYMIVQRSGGTIQDLADAVEMKIQSANVKLSQLRDAYKSETGKTLPALSRRPRTVNGVASGKSAGQLAVDFLKDALAETVNEETETEEFDDEEFADEETETESVNDEVNS